MKIDLVVVCPYCGGRGEHSVEFDKLEIGFTPESKHNHGVRVLCCPFCGDDFVCRIFYTLSFEYFIRKIEPPNFTVVDNGEYIQNEHGHILPKKEEKSG
jgi:hypothetical protein